MSLQHNKNIPATKQDTHNKTEQPQQNKNNPATKTG